MTIRVEYGPIFYRSTLVTGKDAKAQDGSLSAMVSVLYILFRTRHFNNYSLYQY
jgi:hypothetical protein